MTVAGSFKPRAASDGGSNAAHHFFDLRRALLCHRTVLVTDVRVLLVQAHQHTDKLAGGLIDFGGVGSRSEEGTEGHTSTTN